MHKKKVRPKVKYWVIYLHREKLPISTMCQLFAVSRSRYSLSQEEISGRNRELPGEVIERDERMRIVKASPVFPVTSFNLAVVAGCVGPDKLVANAQLCGGFLKERTTIPPGAGKAIGELEAVVGLNALNLHAVTGKDSNSLLEKVGGGISALLKVSAKNMEKEYSSMAVYW